MPPGLPLSARQGLVSELAVWLWLDGRAHESERPDRGHHGRPGVPGARACALHAQAPPSSR